jgi:phosphoenolpyruvate synthase/pyruvate phosphate dikinase
LSGKARTLEGIAPLVARSVVPPLLRFSLRQWRTERQAVLERIQRAFAGQRLAVRSSAFCEDGPQASRAGEFLSLLDIPADAEDTLAGAIDDVAGAMAGDAGRDEFFVQRMVARVRLSGVVFTRDQDTFAPYYVVNYDSTTRRTNTVTSGTSTDLTTLVLHRGRRPRDPDLAGSSRPWPNWRPFSAATAWTWSSPSTGTDACTSCRSAGWRTRKTAWSSRGR